jgi:hypothetical protein
MINRFAIVKDTVVSAEDTKEHRVFKVVGGRKRRNPIFATVVTNSNSIN